MNRRGPSLPPCLHRLAYSPVATPTNPLVLPFIYGPSGSNEGPLAQSRALRMIAAPWRRSLQVHAAEEVLKAWVGARRVEDGGHLQTRQHGFAQLARLHEMREGPLLVVQRQPQETDAAVRDIFSPRPVLQTASQLETLRPATGQGVDPGATPL